MENLRSTIRPEPEHWLEVGLVLLAAGILGGLSVFALGWISEAGRRKKIFREEPPEIGEVSPESHQGILTVATT